MAFETGLVLGAKYFGGARQKNKDFLVLDEVEHQFKKTISDLGGFDGGIHGKDPSKAIGCVRNFLARKSKDPAIPGEAFIVRRFRRFQVALKRMTVAPGAKFSAEELDGMDYIPELINIMVAWQKLPEPSP